MSRGPTYKKADLAGVRTYPIKDRKNLVGIESFLNPRSLQEEADVSLWFPDILKGREIREVAEAVAGAVGKGRPVIFALGAHVIKCGLSPLVIDLVRRGVVTAVAFNGATAIHDFEIAYMGATSEDVAQGLPSGAYGMADETGSMMSEAFESYVDRERGLGEALGRFIGEKGFKHREHSILWACAERGIPLTVHVAIGTDIIHMHPSADGAVIGRGSHNDFLLLSSVISSMGDGGCFFNIGSAVIIPEVFLKALNLARNLGSRVEGFITVNMDMIRHYRPEENVVRRPTSGSGRGYNFVGHHELMLPILYRLILSLLPKTGE